MNILIISNILSITIIMLIPLFLLKTKKRYNRITVLYLEKKTFRSAGLIVVLSCLLLITYTLFNDNTVYIIVLSIVIQLALIINVLLYTNRLPKEEHLLKEPAELAHILIDKFNELTKIVEYKKESDTNKHHWIFYDKKSFLHKFELDIDNYLIRHSTTSVRSDIPTVFPLTDVIDQVPHIFNKT